MLNFTSKLAAPSAVRYVAWQMMGRKTPVQLRLRSGPRFELRWNNSGHLGNADYGVAYEIFVLNYYCDHGKLDPGKVNLVVDLGANVGFSMLYFLHRFPMAHIIGFEPHAGHYAQATRNLMLDGSGHRVALYPNAVGAFSRKLWLYDQGTSSSLSERSAPGTIAAEVIDIFPRLLGKRIDLMKIDIEGGEYEILGDDRFAELDVSAIVMEWHARGDGRDGRSWCYDRLRKLGYTVEETWAEQRVGMLWAWRAAQNASAR